MVSFSLGGMTFEYDDNKNKINIKLTKEYFAGEGKTK